MDQIFPASEFSTRRAKLTELAGSDVWLLVQSAPPVDGFTVFRQTNEFMYLTGLTSAQSLLLIGGGYSVLFLPSNGLTPPGEGETYGYEDADEVLKITGVDAVYPSETLRDRLPESGVLLTPLAPAEGRLACQDTLRHAAKQIAHDEWEYLPSRELRLAEKVRQHRPKITVGDLSPLLNRLRLVKSSREVDVMRRTGLLSALAVAAAMQATKPGIYEYQLGAIADYVFKENGAVGEGYRPIIATGANIWHPHYYKNDSVLVDGELVLMDYAPDYLNYTNDIGRLWPVNGKYSTEQRELYGFVLRYHKELLRRIKPGLLPSDILKDTATVMSAVIEETLFSRPSIRNSALAMLDFKGHLSHPVGMSVHDVGRYFDQPLQKGMVFAVDPQMWIREEQLYIRVEDTVAVTSDGVEVLTGAVPIEIDEIESLISGKGMLQLFPPIKEFS